jgi:beta-lactam-binding protein with PASTA domain
MANHFLKKFLSLYFWGNILAMAIIVVLLATGLKYGLDLYTRHGQTVEVPNVVKKTFNDAEDMLDQLHLTVVVSDTDYVKTLPPNTVLEQSPSAGDIVKPGRIVYLKINSPSTPKRPLPDIIDNS